MTGMTGENAYMILVLQDATNLVANAMLLNVQVWNFALELFDFLQEVFHRGIDIIVLILVVINLEQGSVEIMHQDGESSVAQRDVEIER